MYIIIYLCICIHVCITFSVCLHTSVGCYRLPVTCCSVCIVMITLRHTCRYIAVHVYTCRSYRCTDLIVYMYVAGH